MRIKLIVSVLCCLLFTDIVAGNSIGISNSYQKTLDNGLSVKIDERMELVCIAFRLAGAEEYTYDLVPGYMEEIDSYFSPYKGHELFEFIRKTREEYNFGYSIAAKSAFMIDIVDGRVRVCKDWDVIGEFSEEYRQCWTEQIFRKYVKLLDDFYRESGFNKFFMSHGDFYDEAVSRNMEIPSMVNMSWFEDFYGQPAVNVDLYLGLCTGESNYSIPVEHKGVWEGRTAIVVGTKADYDGIPVISETCYPVLIHEISHFYSSPVIDECWNAISDPMDFVFSKVKEDMAKIGYGSAISVAGEWINGLFTNLYLKNEYESGRYDYTYLYNVGYDESVGFIWMGRSVMFMENFFKDRHIYPTIDSFIPQLVAFANLLPSEWTVIEKEFASRCPYVVEVYPAGGKVSPETKLIRVRFSEPMVCGIQGLSKIDGYDMLPFDYDKCQWESDTVFAIDLGHLESGKTYGVQLPRVFCNLDFVTLSEDFNIIIKVE